MEAGREWLSYVVVVALTGAMLGFPADGWPAERGRDHLKRAKVYLAAGDYRRALDACQREIDEAPSVAAYVYLTYVYQALDGYVEYLAKTDQWVPIEQLYRSLTFTSTQDLIDPPEVLARMAKEMIQDGARRQSDIAAAMAARLDKETVNRLWKIQSVWRTARPESWWAGAPDEWGW
jgi:tetratricopeptide (TPR) repeat protein